MSEMAVAMLRAHFSPDQSMRRVAQFVDIRRLYGLGETRPTASRFMFVGRPEQWFARYDINVNARFLVFQIFAGSWGLSPVLLVYAILFRRQSGHGIGCLAIVGHLCSFITVLVCTRRSF